MNHVTHTAVIVAIQVMLNKSINIASINIYIYILINVLDCDCISSFNLMSA